MSDTVILEQARRIVIREYLGKLRSHGMFISKDKCEWFWKMLDDMKEEFGAAEAEVAALERKLNAPDYLRSQTIGRSIVQIALKVFSRCRIATNAVTNHIQQTRPGTPSLSSSKEPTLSSLSTAAIHEPNSSNNHSSPVSSADPAMLDKSLQIKGEVIGSESLYIDGNIEGTINLPGSRVTVSRDALVAANITAREVVVLGKVSGNIYASDRVDIHSEGSLTGDVTTRRITIGEGAFFKGGIDIRKADQGKNKVVVAGTSGDQAQAAATIVQAQQSALRAS
jgi:cytoskeletal protein CcmA (bactofilin family)